MKQNPRVTLSGERGAVQIKTILAVVLVVAAIIVGIKVIPVYVQGYQVKHDVEEAARQAAIGTLKTDADVNKRLLSIQRDYELPEGSLTLVSRKDETAQIAVKYAISIDFFVTTYLWQVDYVSAGKSL